MVNFIKFVKSNSSEKFRMVSLIMSFYIILINPAITISKIDSLILLNAPIFLFSYVGYIIFTIKQYKNYTKLQQGNK